MIAFIEGEVNHLEPTHVYINCGGVGYHVNIGLHTFSRIEGMSQVKLFTYLHVTENSHSLYGFYDEAEKKMFTYLISVSGIGPNTARVVLSYMTYDEARSAIISENVAAFNKVKGIGPKTAKRIILDLKDKVFKEMGEGEIISTVSHNTIRDEALSALVALGFQRKIVEKQVDQALAGNQAPAEVEELIKIVLRNMS